MVSTQLTDRRRLRHAQTREQIVVEALQIMRTQGVGGLSLGELARRIGVRTPSLYTYFDSKAALYDELFRRGWQECVEDARRHLERLGPVTSQTSAGERLLDLNATFVRWALAHPELSQLMLFRPVPLWEPTESAYEPAVRLFGMLEEEVRACQAQGLVLQDADLAEMTENIANAAAGVIARQLANEPGASYERGRASRHYPALMRSVCRPYLTRPTGRSTSPDPIGGAR